MSKRSKVQPIAPASPEAETDTPAQPAEVEAPVARVQATDPTVTAFGFVKTAEGWVACTFHVPLSHAVARREPDVKLIAVENFKLDLARHLASAG